MIDNVVIDKTIPATRTDAVALAQALIRCPSVTPADAGAQDVLRAALTPLGFTCTDVPFNNIKNIFARLGDRGPHLCFCGHTDVVPAGDETLWDDPPFAAVIRDDILYGRGASDMKTNIACFIAAADAYIAAHDMTDKSISLLITGDEEAEAVDGTVRVLEWLRENNQTPDAALVGEPTNPDYIGQEIKLGRRGSLNGRLTVTGAQGHTAYPHRADNPIPRMITLLNALATSIFDTGSEFFPPTNLQITTVDVGNTAANVIPAAGHAQFNVRFNDLWTADTLSARIRAILDETGLPYDLQLASNAASFMTAPGPLTDAMINAVETVTGHTPQLTTSGGTSDARFVRMHCPVVEFGLVNKTIHKTNECTRVADIHALSAVYYRFIENYFAG